MATEVDMIAAVNSMPPLPKTHVPYGFQGSFILDPANQEKLEMVARTCGALTVFTESVTQEQMDVVLPICKEYGAGLAIRGKPWHRKYQNGVIPPLDPRIRDQTWWEELTLFHNRCVVIKFRMGDDHTLLRWIIHETEVFRIEPETPGWDEALDDNYEAMYLVMGMVFPGAQHEWFSRNHTDQLYTMQANIGPRISRGVRNIPNQSGTESRIHAFLADARTGERPGLWMGLGGHGPASTFRDPPDGRHDPDYARRLGAVIHRDYRQPADPDLRKVDTIFLWPTPFDPGFTDDRWLVDFVEYVGGAHGFYPFNKGA